MPNIFIDPFVFACPQPEEGLEQFQNYIDSILSWRDLRAAGWAPIYISAQTSEVLAITNSYPPWDSLVKAISAFQLEDVQAKDVVDLINALLTKLPTIEDNFFIDDVLIDEVTIDPYYHIADRLPLFVEQYERISILICIIGLLKDLALDDIILITKRLNEDRCFSVTEGKVIEFESCIDLDLPEIPFVVKDKFWLCNTPAGLYMSIEPTAIWKAAHNPDQYQTAIRIYVYQISHEKDSPVIMNEIAWSFHGQFLNTARRFGFLHEDRKVKNLLRACAETILDINMRGTHALRQGHGPEEAQKTRGSDKAWRRDIDYDYHLHYWETANGPEFAAVVMHNDMNIPG